MVHVLPLPGSAGYDGNMKQVLKTALKDAEIYQAEGVDALLVENMHDAPYLNGAVDPETTAAMSVVAAAVKDQCKLPLGVQILAGANIEALGVAVACNLDFIRVEGFVYAHVGDEGFHDSCAGRLIRRRAQLRADKIKIFADIKKKHSSHAITADTTLVDTAHAAEFFQADGVIVTGSATGRPADIDEIKSVRAEVKTPVLVGSGITPENIQRYAQYSDALIVGTSCKQNGNWRNPVDAQRVRQLVEQLT